MLLGPELGFQDWHHPNKHHGVSNTAGPTNPSALPHSLRGPQQGEKQEEEKDGRRHASLLLPTIAQPCDPEARAPLSPPEQGDNPGADWPLFTCRKAGPGALKATR